MGNQKLSTISLVFCLILFTVYIQGILAQGCSSSDVIICRTNYANAYSAAANDHGKICSAGHQFLDCLDNVLAACGTEGQSSQSLHQAKQYLNQARQALNQNVCGAADLLFNVVFMASGLAFSYIFKKIND
ncbi:uncharacterized protein LOC133193371 [Saccostrea echinata]|uniref:uncharacterized protein LOC133193371 n=1 Tax=Saccostrea echinata TaxID=191078 RepID=UPI002A80673C|nr:uncharacterized protein LOC133193371 [Saccostrea echinata]